MFVFETIRRRLTEMQRSKKRKISSTYFYLLFSSSLFLSPQHISISFSKTLCVSLLNIFLSLSYFLLLCFSLLNIFLSLSYFILCFSLLNIFLNLSPLLLSLLLSLSLLCLFIYLFVIFVLTLFNDLLKIVMGD